MPTLSIDDAIRTLRADPEFRGQMVDSYLDEDVPAAIDRFERSAEWQIVLRLLDGVVPGATVLDLGAGIGMASAAFLKAGAGRVIAVEPDISDVVGQGAMRRAGVAAEIVTAFGEDLPIGDASVDIVYCRQVLHHAADLAALAREVARVLSPGGVFIACREHVVSDDEELRVFLAAHPVNRLAGGEHAFRLAEYERAIRKAGLKLRASLGPRDSLINAFPIARDDGEFDRLPREWLAARLGPAGGLLGRLPGVGFAYRRLSRGRGAGRLFTFVAEKPLGS